MCCDDIKFALKSVVAVHPLAWRVVDIVIALLLWRTHCQGFIYLVHVHVLTPVGLTALLLRVWGRVKKFIYWLLLNHFFLLGYFGVYLPHTIKSAVFLLYFTCFLWKTLHKVNITRGRILSCILQ